MDRIAHVSRGDGNTGAVAAVRRLLLNVARGGCGGKQSVSTTHNTALHESDRAGSRWHFWLPARLIDRQRYDGPTRSKPGLHTMSHVSPSAT